MAQKITVNGVDVTQYLQYGSLTVKLNTCDFTLIDAPFASANLGYAVVVKDPGWTGTVAQYTDADIVDRQSGHYSTTVSATNTDVIVDRGPAPFGLNDVPSAPATDRFLKEDGSGVLVLEDGSAFAPGNYLLETAAERYGYRRLSNANQLNLDLSTTTKVTATIFQPGLWPGMSVYVFSSNLGLAPPPGSTHLVSQVTTTWAAGQPVFVVEMTASLTDTLPTLSKWRVNG